MSLSRHEGNLLRLTAPARYNARGREIQRAPQDGWNGSAFGEYGLMFMIPLASG